MLPLMRARAPALPVKGCPANFKVTHYVLSCSVVTLFKAKGIVGESADVVNWRSELVLVQFEQVARASRP